MSYKTTLAHLVSTMTEAECLDLLVVGYPALASHRSERAFREFLAARRCEIALAVADGLATACEAAVARFEAEHGHAPGAAPAPVVARHRGRRCRPTTLPSTTPAKALAAAVSRRIG